MENQNPTQPSMPVAPQNPIQEPTPSAIKTPQPIIPPAPEPVIQTPSEPSFGPKPKLSKWIIVAIIILVLIIVSSSVAYVLNKNSTNNKTACTTEAKLCPDGSSVGRTGPKCEFTTCPKTTPIPDSASNAADATADWETYTNSENGYSIKYPKVKFVRIICPNKEFNLITRGVDKRDTVTMDDCSSDMRMEIEITTTVPPEPKEDEFISVTSEPIIVGGIKGTKYISRYKEGSSESSLIPEYSEDIYFSNNGKKYNIYLRQKDLQLIFNQMLSTFKFTQ